MNNIIRNFAGIKVICHLLLTAIWLYWGICVHPLTFGWIGWTILIGGGFTYFSFKPCCEKLRENLKDTSLSNPNHVSTEEEIIFTEQIETE